MWAFKLVTFTFLLFTGLTGRAQDSLLNKAPKASFRDKITNDLSADSMGRKAPEAASGDKVKDEATTGSVQKDTAKVASVIAFDSSSNIIVLPQEKRGGIFSWRDSVVIPKRSAFYSLMFPGLGQINNREQLYIKLPIIYGLLGAGIYFFIDNSTKYNDARREYAYRLDKGTFLLPKYENFSLADVQGEKDYYKRFLDMTVLLSVAGYGLQVIEANAAAHLKGFDVSDDISLQIRPTGMPTPYGLVPGVTFAFKLR
ncbi:MAG: hypothetical protein BGO31_16410 [Bacteroidetes bacterium 43-16]|nr:MAG: hypothetical protein BGO31_16410 [Bacteroidetes bacterium 43-16]